MDLEKDRLKLSKRARRCPAFAWRVGMAYWLVEEIGQWPGRVDTNSFADRFAFPDLEDSQTQVHILALIRERLHDETAALVRSPHGTWAVVGAHPLLRDRSPARQRSSAEEALVAALEDAAEQ